MGGCTNFNVNFTNNNTGGSGGGGGCDSSSNVNYILSNVLSIVNELSNISASSNVDYLNTITSISESEFFTNNKQLDIIKYLTTNRIPGEFSNLGPPYGIDRLFTETLGGICVIQNKYKQLNGKSILIEKYFNGSSSDTLFPSASMGKIQLVMIVSSMIKQGVSWYNGGTLKTFSLLTTVDDIVDGTDILSSGLLPGISSLRIVDFLQFKTGISQQSGLMYMMNNESGSPPFLTNYYLQWNIMNNKSTLNSTDPGNQALYDAGKSNADTILTNATLGYGPEAVYAYFAGVYDTHPDSAYFPDASTYSIDLTAGPNAMDAAKTLLINNATSVPFDISIRAWINSLRSDPSTYTLGYLLNLLSFILPEIIENPIEVFFSSLCKQRVVADDGLKQGTGPNRSFEYDFETYPLLSWLVQIAICKVVRDATITGATEFTDDRYYKLLDANSLDYVYRDIQLNGLDNLYGTPYNQTTVELLRDNVRGYFQRHILLPAGVGRNNLNCILQAGPSGCIYYDYNRFTLPDLTKIGSLILKDLHLMGWTGNNASTFTTRNCDATVVMDGYHLYNIITMCNADVPGDPSFDYNNQSMFNIPTYIAPLTPTIEDVIAPAFMSVSNNMPIMSNGMWVVQKNGRGFTNNNMSTNLVTSSSDFQTNRNSNYIFEAQRIEWHGSGGQMVYLDPEHDTCITLVNIPFEPRTILDRYYYQGRQDTVYFNRLNDDVLSDLGLYQVTPYYNMSNTITAFDFTEINKYLVYNASRIVPDFNAYVLGFDRTALLGLFYNKETMNRFSSYLNDNTVSLTDEGFDSYPLLAGTDTTFYQMVRPLPGVAPTDFTYPYPVATLINYFNDVINPKIITTLL